MTALLVMTASPLRTANADEAAQARYHDDRAREHYAGRRYAAALREFFLEQRLAPNPRIVFNIALCLDNLGRSDDAFTFFSDYLADPADSDATRREYAQTALARLSAKVARIRVSSEPAGATLYVDRRDLGAYGVSPRVLALPPGEHKLWLEREGYLPAERSIHLTAGVETLLSVTMELIVAPLHVEGPPRSSVTVLDETANVVTSGSVPLTTPLRPGVYEVHVAAEGYKEWSSTTRVVEGVGARIAAALEPLPEPVGDLTVTANSRGARVSLDGRLMGFAPSVFSSLPVGIHQLEVQREGLLDWRGPITIKPARRTWATVTLERPGQIERSLWSYGLGASGLLTTLAGAVFYGLASSKYDDYQVAATRGTAPGAPTPATLYEEGARHDRLGTVLVTTGLLQVGVGTLLYFTTRKTLERPSTANAEVAE